MNQLLVGICCEMSLCTTGAIPLPGASGFCAGCPRNGLGAKLASKTLSTLMVGLLVACSADLSNPLDGPLTSCVLDKC